MTERSCLAVCNDLFVFFRHFPKALITFYYKSNLYKESIQASKNCRREFLWNIYKTACRYRNSHTGCFLGKESSTLLCGCFPAQDKVQFIRETGNREAFRTKKQECPGRYPDWLCQKCDKSIVGGLAAWIFSTTNSVFFGDRGTGQYYQSSRKASHFAACAQ